MMGKDDWAVGILRLAVTSELRLRSDGGRLNQMSILCGLKVQPTVHQIETRALPPTVRYTLFLWSSLS